jgi:lysozyme family protein
MKGDITMADFNISYKLIEKNEGLYGCDPTDKGGETYKGIARKRNPYWKGWIIVDKYKLLPNFPKNMYSDVELDTCVKLFYKEEYWDINKLDNFSSQILADELLDTGVNMGVGKAAKFLQLTLNVLNKNGASYPDILEDGKVGPGTLQALNTCIGRVGEEVIYKVLNVLQGNHYIDIMVKNPTQEKYTLGWLSRVTFIKK